MPTGTLMVSPATLTVSGITANNIKSYDGTTTATLSIDLGYAGRRGVAGR